MAQDKLAARAQRLITIIPEIMKRLFRGQDDVKDELTFAQRKVLHTLGCKGRIKMGELSSCLGVEMSTVTVVIDALVAKGYVERKRDTADRRVVLVELKGKGKELFKKVVEQFRKNIADMFSKMPEAKQEKVIAAFEQLYEIFKEEDS